MSALVRFGWTAYAKNLIQLYADECSSSCASLEWIRFVSGGYKGSSWHLI